MTSRRVGRPCAKTAKPKTIKIKIKKEPKTIKIMNELTELGVDGS